jgi:hypothetical protein
LRPPLGFLDEIIDAHLLKEAFLGYYLRFLGGRFTTKVWLNECLINVSEFLQSFFYLNGYGIFYLHFNEISWIKP